MSMKMDTIKKGVSLYAGKKAEPAKEEDETATEYIKYIVHTDTRLIHIRVNDSFSMSAFFK